MSKQRTQDSKDGQDTAKGTVGKAGGTVGDKEGAAHTPPAPAVVEATWEGPAGALGYRAEAGWTVLREKDKPVAEMFSVSYVATSPHDEEDEGPRPVTFIFNGGPGASSAYLHLGALGPRRVRFNDDGTAPPPPSRLAANPESWLEFSDLVFIDPIGTGFSRLIDADAAKPEGDKAEPPAAKDSEQKAKRFWAFKRDLESIGEFVRRWLAANGRWDSPVFIAGESYGGYRVARLARLLPEDYGVGLNGVVIISPALEFSLLIPGDYDALAWLDLLPSMAAGAHHHGKGRALPVDAGLEEVIAAAEEFATGDYVAFLTQGAAMPAARREQVLGRLADFLGLPLADVRRAEGRITLIKYARSLLAETDQVVGVYDASMVAANPFPDRDGMTWPDPTLSGVERIFAAGANQQIRGEIGVRTDREYHLLSHEVNTSWFEDGEVAWVTGPRGATDDLRYALSLSPHTRYFLCHGRFDLVTPYHSSNRLVNLMRLRESDADRFTVRHYLGGHMFYTWSESRRRFRDEIRDFYAQALGR